MEKQKCETCDNTFDLRRQGRGRRRRFCDECKKERLKGQMKAASKKYRQSNPERHNEHCRKYRQKNKEKMRKYNREYQRKYRENPEKMFKAKRRERYLKASEAEKAKMRARYHAKKIFAEMKQKPADMTLMIEMITRWNEE